MDYNELVLKVQNCPKCQARKRYRLADGRRKCAECGAKFSIRPRKSRLSAAVRAELLSLFWKGVPAERAASIVRVNRKTALAYFRRFRLAIVKYESASAERASEAGSRQAAAAERTSRTPVFGIQEGLRAIRVLMPGEAQALGGIRNASISWVYAPSGEAARRLRLDSFFRIGRQEVVRWHGRAQISRADRFWSFARDRLRIYRGGYRGDFPLFLKEMAFRFNARSNPGGFAALRAAVAAMR